MTVKKATPNKSTKTVKPKVQNEITDMGEVLQSLGNSLDQVYGCLGLGRLGFDPQAVNDSMDVNELLDIMARNGIRFCVKGGNK